MEGKPPVKIFRGTGDDYWLWLNTKGRRSIRMLRDLLPALPEVRLQERLTGMSGDKTLRDGWRFYRVVKRLYARQLEPSTTVLDFGCGWGRTIRFFLKDTHHDNLYGVDASEAAIEACRETNRWVQFDHVELFGPTSLPGSSFDLVYAYSVFSHLSEEVHDCWLSELHRLLKPGAMLVVTTRHREFPLTCRTKRVELGDNWESVSTTIPALGYAAFFDDPEAALADYDAGRYCYSNMELDGPHFGNACISRAYAARHWSDRFELVDYITDRTVDSQNVIVARKL